MTQVKINKVFGETPVNVILYKNDEGKVTKMEVNNRKFSSERMGKAFMESELKLTAEQVNEVMADAGEVSTVEVKKDKTSAKGKSKEKTTEKQTTPKEIKEPVKFTQSFRTGKTVVEVSVEEKVESNKKVLSGVITDKVTEEVSTFGSKDQAVEILLTKYAINKTTALKMLKAECPIAMTGEQLASLPELKNAELEDIGVIGKAVRTPKTPKEPRKPIDGYPKWVLRDPQDVNQYNLVQEAKASGYSAKILEAVRATRGYVSVAFGEDMLWHVGVTTMPIFVGSDEYKPLKERLDVLKAGDVSKNEALASTEKRYAIFLARALAGTYKLAFDEKVDVQKVETGKLLTQERRKSVYNR